ncbi:serine/threonine protein kinase [Streptomyces sp. So13.3]|uniref:serine/threonine-protein kinase n=1 Tax=unclassified Streptomyces TaxID=2593676 RepID=UPI0011064908|nr:MULTISPECIES: serine/threonine-protein kinase [unclassified Streptomyces]MCZ4098417.1 serine/threonine-protein kinase [Streptomyces sp. H39-C1]QNA77348.1 serine/threonine protein kinase [Streptomyces sp. So13.3]
MHVLEPGDPRRIGEFTLVGRLGSGGMGQVFLGRSAGGRAVAVKVVKAALAEVPEFRARFRQEVAALHRVGGEGTAPVLGADTEAAAPWVATEYVPGPALDQVVGSGYGPLPEATLHALAGRLARALCAIHGAGLVHRDLKPSNILLTVDGPRIIDFGIARALDTAAGSVRTSTGVVLGSPGFMSPEQVRGQPVTAAADVFSLGSVLVYAATGRLPFGSAELGPHALMFRAAEEEPDLTGVPQALTGLVTACLDKDPQRRPTAEQLAAGTHTDADGPWLPAELLTELGRLAARILTAETPPQIPPVEASPQVIAADAPPLVLAAQTPSQGSTAPTRFTRRWRPVLAAVVTLAAVAAGVALILRDGGDKGPAAGSTHSATAPASNSASPSAGPGVPNEFVGAWEGVVEGNSDLPKRVLRLEIAPGRPGDKVAAYIDTDRNVQCTGRSKLVSTDADTVVVAAGQVTAGVPQGRCKPLSQQTLKVRSRDVLVWTSGGLTADFYRSAGGGTAVPDQYVGVWVPANPAYREKELISITQGPVGGRLVRISGMAGMEDGTEQFCDSTLAIGAVSPVLALSPPTYAAKSGKGCREPSAIFFMVGRDGHLLLYSMDADAEPGEYVRKSS